MHGAMSQGGSGKQTSSPEIMALQTPSLEGLPQYSAIGGMYGLELT